MRVGGFAIFMTIVLALPLLSYGSPRVQVNRGNQAASSGDPNAAMIHYKRALDQHGDSSVVLYDIGNVLYQSGNYEQALQAYAGSLSPQETITEQSETLYNLGNSLFQNQKYDKAAEAYIESLKRNPGDLAAKYNLELAKRMLREQQQQQQQEQNQDQQDQKNEQQQQQNPQDQQKQDSQDKQQQQQDQQQEQQEQQAQQNSSQQMTPEEAERLLNALLQNEQNALKDAKKVKVMARAKREKDW